jgi:indole-3-acetate monooxygenase
MNWRHFELDDATAATIESLRAILTETERRAEEERQLPAEAVDALRQAGLFKVALPRQVGGLEVDPLYECEVYEAVARISPTACWNLFVGKFAYRDSDGLHRRRWLPGNVGRGTVGARCRPVCAHGRWRTRRRGSSRVGPLLVGERDRPCELGAERACVVDDAAIGFVVPIENVDVLDNWYVAGLSGTRGADYELKDVFVPDGSGSTGWSGSSNGAGRGTRRTSAPR